MTANGNGGTLVEKSDDEYTDDFSDKTGTRSGTATGTMGGKRKGRSQRASIATISGASKNNTNSTTKINSPSRPLLMK